MCFFFWQIGIARAVYNRNFGIMATEASRNDKEHMKVLNELQALRNEQRNIVSTISTLELDLKEHKWV